MLLNYIKIAIRNIQRNKLHSFINILGLSIGLTCTILILLYVLDEFSYDRHNSKHDRIYLVESMTEYEDEVFSTPYTGAPLMNVLKSEYPDIEKAARIRFAGRKIFEDKNGGIIREDKSIYYADPEIFNIFDHEFVYGSSEGALDSPHTMVLSEKLAKKYFGEQNPVGNMLKVHNGNSYTVTGVFKNLPKNTSFPYDGLITMRDIPERTGNAYQIFTGFDVTTFILLKKNGDIKTLSEDYKRFQKKHMPEPDYDKELEYTLLTDYYLQQKVTFKLKFTRLERANFLSIIAFLILMIACINYMNLETARSMGRAKEVGVRKVLGAVRSSLIRQFLCESIIITLFAMIIAIALVEMLLPSFNILSSKEFSIAETGGISLLLTIFTVTLGTGVIAGSYPAIFLSKYSPTRVLGKNCPSGAGRGILRKLLVVIQYTISIVMIICMMLSIKQMNFVSSIDPGFNKDGVFDITPLDKGSRNKLPVLEDTISKYSGISAAARTSLSISVINESGGGPTYACKVEGPGG